jgi:hypothetical protein
VFYELHDLSDHGQPDDPYERSHGIGWPRRGLSLPAGSWELPLRTKCSTYYIHVQSGCSSCCCWYVRSIDWINPSTHLARPWLSFGDRRWLLRTGSCCWFARLGLPVSGGARCGCPRRGLAITIDLTQGRPRGMDCTVTVGTDVRLCG